MAIDGMADSVRRQTVGRELMQTKMNEKGESEPQMPAFDEARRRVLSYTRVRDSRDKYSTHISGLEEGGWGIETNAAADRPARRCRDDDKGQRCPKCRSFTELW